MQTESLLDIYTQPTIFFLLVQALQVLQTHEYIVVVIIVVRLTNLFQVIMSIKEL